MNNQESLKRKQLAIIILKLIYEQSKDQRLKPLLLDLEKVRHSMSLQEELNKFPKVKAALYFYMHEYHYWSKAYSDVIKGKQAEHQQAAGIFDFFKSIQPKLKFDITKFEDNSSVYKEFQNSYYLQINIAKPKYKNWTKQFVSAWRIRKEQISQQQKKRRLAQSANNTSNDKKPTQNITTNQTTTAPSRQPQKTIPPKIQVPPPAKQMIKPVAHSVERAPEKYQERSLTPPPVQQTETKKVPTLSKVTQQQKQQQSVQTIKKPSGKTKRQKNGSDSGGQFSEVSQDITKKRGRSPKPIEQPPKTQFVQQHRITPQQKPKNRVLILMKYLKSRKDLQIDNSKLEMIARFLNSKLETFMKSILIKIINAAKLKNHGYEGPEAGDEFRYFSKYHPMTCNVKTFVPSNSKLKLIKYPSKLQIYSQMRVAEEHEQEKLRIELQKKRESLEKKKENKILDFILRQRQTRTEGWVYSPEAPTTRLVISNAHVQFILESHPWFKDGICMFKSYY